MKISVIITNFNGEVFLDQAIKSFLDQDYENKELIIVDGISKDKSHQIIEKYAQQNPLQIKWIKEVDSGISNARNIALKHVSGDLIGFLGSDDILHQDFFKNLSYYLKVDDKFDVAYFNNYCVGKSYSYNLGCQHSITFRNLIKYCPIASGEAFYYKKSIFDYFKFNEHNRYSMDYELNLAISSFKSASKSTSKNKYLFFPIDLVAVINRDTGLNQSSLNSKKQRLESIAVQLKYADNFLIKIKIIIRSYKLFIKNYRQILNYLKILS
ncbi:MAG: glycosyltransferase [Alphaproteobacteria bacterium]